MDEEIYRKKEKIPVPEDFRDMYLDSTDPLRIEAQKRDIEIKNKLADKRADTGL